MMTKREATIWCLTLEASFTIVIYLFIVSKIMIIMMFTVQATQLISLKSSAYDCNNVHSTGHWLTAGQAGFEPLIS
jgi:hypothetical protein